MRLKLGVKLVRFIVRENLDSARFLPLCFHAEKCHISRELLLQLVPTQLLQASHVHAL